MADGYKVAVWRYDQISPFEDDALTPAERDTLIAQRTGKPVRWPSGDDKPIPRSTLYRWWAAYRKPCKRCRKRKKCPPDRHCEKQLQALLPKRRKDLGKPRRDRSQWVQKGIQMLLVRPARSLTLLLAFLKARFSDDLEFNRSTLNRELHAHPVWPLIRRQRKRIKRLRIRYEPKFAHEIWHLDGKGPFTVRLESGKEIRVTILTILEAYSRVVLAVTISTTESTAAAVRVFRSAVRRWGLPHRIIADRHSAYDSDCFREGLACLGVNRAHFKPKTPEWNGKLERYHFTLTIWYVDEIPHQVVVDEEHLLQLLQAVIDVLYQKHYHRELKMSPEEALKGRHSDRPPVGINELRNAFWVKKRLKAHPVTGEVELPGGPFVVPASYAGTKVDLRFDPAEPGRVQLIGKTGRKIKLKPRSGSRPRRKKSSQEQKRGAGELQRLVDVWHGRKLPLASAGWGFPELCDALGEYLGRFVPMTEDEAELIQEFYRKHGPFAPKAFKKAFDRAKKALGPDRPVKAILDYLTRLIVPNDPDRKEKSS